MEYSRCGYCQLPAVCFGADLFNPQFRCPIHCREYPQFGGFHGDENYLKGHISAEGLTITVR